MRYLWRNLTGRCTCCGQKLHVKQTSAERLARINRRAHRLAKALGRWPQVQRCRKCSKLVFEGEAGFVPKYLLIDLLPPIHREKARIVPAAARAEMECAPV